MIVIDKDSRFTFKVDREGRVNRTITQKDQITKRAAYQNDYITEGANYQEACNYQENEIHLACAHMKMRNSPHIQTTLHTIPVTFI